MSANGCAICDKPATMDVDGEPFCSPCGAHVEAQWIALANAPKPPPPAFDSARSDRDLRYDEARAVCADRASTWCSTTSGRSSQGAHVECAKVGGGALAYTVGYVWSTPYSHHISGRVYTCVMGRGSSLADALIAAERRHASNIKRAEKRSGGAK